MKLLLITRGEIPQLLNTWTFDERVKQYTQWGESLFSNTRHFLEKHSFILSMNVVIDPKYKEPSWVEERPFRIIVPSVSEHLGSFLSFSSPDQFMREIMQHAQWRGCLFSNISYFEKHPFISPMIDITHYENKEGYSECGYYVSKNCGYYECGYYVVNVNSVVVVNYVVNCCCCCELCCEFVVVVNYVVELNSLIINKIRCCCELCCECEFHEECGYYVSLLWKKTSPHSLRWNVKTTPSYPLYKLHLYSFNTVNSQVWLRSFSETKFFTSTTTEYYQGKSSKSHLSILPSPSFTIFGKLRKDWRGTQRNPDSHFSTVNVRHILFWDWIRNDCILSHQQKKRNFCS